MKPAVFKALKLLDTLAQSIQDEYVAWDIPFDRARFLVRTIDEVADSLESGNEFNMGDAYIGLYAEIIQEAEDKLLEEEPEFSASLQAKRAHMWSKEARLLREWFPFVKDGTVTILDAIRRSLKGQTPDDHNLSSDEGPPIPPDPVPEKPPLDEFKAAWVDLRRVPG